MMPIAEIIQEVENYYGLTSGKVLSWCRTSTVARARAMSIYLSKRHTIYTYPEISEYFKREISSVKKASAKLKKNISINTGLAHDFYILDSRCALHNNNRNY